MPKPITLPPGWTQEHIAGRGTIISSPGPECYAATVNEQVRNFELGHGVVVRTKSNRSGRGWRQALYDDAIAAIQNVIDQVAARRKANPAP